MILHPDDPAAAIPYKGHIIYMKHGKISVYIGAGNGQQIRSFARKKAVYGPEILSMDSFMQAKRIIDYAFEKYLYY